LIGNHLVRTASLLAKERTLASTSEPFGAGGRWLGVLHVAVTGAVVAGLLFVLCWIGTFIPFSSPTHAYIALFTPAPMSSIAALIEGTCWSLAFGALIGALVALVYNGLGGLFRG
jgi:hypothetical protein